MQDHTVTVYVLSSRFVKDQPRRDKAYVDLGPKLEQVDHIHNYKQSKVIDRNRKINKVSETYVNTDVQDIKTEKRHTSLHLGEDWTLKRARDRSVVVDKCVSEFSYNRVHVKKNTQSI